MFNLDSNHNLLNGINNLSSEIGYIYNSLNNVNHQLSLLYSQTRNQSNNNSTSIFGNPAYPLNNPSNNNYTTNSTSFFSNPINSRRNRLRNRYRPRETRRDFGTYTIPTDIPIFETSFSNLPMPGRRNNQPNQSNQTNHSNQSNQSNRTNHTNQTDNTNQSNQTENNMEIDGVEITVTSENVEDNGEDNDYYTETFNLNLSDRNESLRNILSNLIAYRLGAQRSSQSQLSNLRDINNNTELEIFTTNEGDEEETCVVCHEEIENNSIVRKIKKCGHYFHYKCLDKWLENHLTCPHCRQNIVESDTNTNADSNNTESNNNNNDNRNTSHSTMI